VHGQWEGPFDLGSLIKYPLPTPPGGTNPEGEIAHACVLPVGEYAGQVLLWCWPDADSSPYIPQTYIWDPNDPRGPVNLDIQPVPAELDGSEDIFCAGHSFLPNGDLLAPGGRDFTFTGATGVADAFLFQQASGTWMKLPNAMARDHYYPSTVRNRDGNIVVLGHTDSGEPPPLTPTTEQIREEYDVLTGAFLPLDENQDFASGCVTTDDYIAISDYPKVFALSNNSLLWVDAENRPPVPDPPLHTSYVIDLEQPACPSGPGELFRWEQGVETPHLAQHAGGNAVHMLFLDNTGSVSNEVIYNMGGTEHPFDDGSACEAPVINLVEVLDVPAGPPDQAPSETTVWDDLGVPDMRYERFNSNAVVLLDGSILIVGGLGKDAASVCTGWLRPERFEPPEVFGPGALLNWTLLAPQQLKRLYHSVAALLQDGRVMSAGGRGTGSPSPSHSIEVFKPSYFFRSKRPSIDTVDSVVSYGSLSFLTITVSATHSAIDRVALLSPSSVTHTAAFDQRYMELSFTEFSPPTGSPPQLTLEVTWPKDSDVAPEGYYLLTAVDINDVPSPAVIVKLQ